MQAEVDEVRARHGIDGSVRYLENNGMLGPDVIAAHCIYIDDEEVDVLARTGTRVAHSPVSNVKIEARISAVAGHAAGRCRAGTGHRLRRVEQWHGLVLGDEVPACSTSRRPATRRSCRQRSFSAWRRPRRRACWGWITSSEASRWASVPIWSPWTGTASTWRRGTTSIGDLVYAARGADVRNVFVDGRAIVLDRHPLAVDAAELARKVSAMGARLRDLADPGRLSIVGRFGSDNGRGPTSR